jgi:lysophospholipase L1-like esterase
VIPITENINTRILAILLRFSGCAFVVWAGLYNELLFKLIRPGVPVNNLTISVLHSVQLRFLILGVLQILLALGISRWAPIRKVLQNNLWVNLALSGLILFNLVAFVEYTFRPFAYRSRSMIYMPDKLLGWKHRPNSADYSMGGYWTINSKGLIGPEISYARTDHKIRILYLGDSVTFGSRLSGYPDTFPCLIEPLLQDRTAVGVETINAGVSGYAGWQEHAYLTTEGQKYDPDLVVLSFVHNDVVNLISADPADKTRAEGLVYSGFYYNSGICFLARKLQPLFDKKLPAGLRLETKIPDNLLIVEPDRPDVKQAWSLALADLAKTAQFCREHHFPLLLIAFPITFQFEDADKYDAPHQILAEFAARENIAFLDLLPPLAQAMKQEGATPRDYYLDNMHFSVRGNHEVARIISDFMLERGLVGKATGREVIRRADPHGYIPVQVQ